ncbi:Cobyrinic acid ac-diamide synthase [Desulfarculus baarsii DSM 2075]|uniref:Cobyrinic acid ac-diamide synthase n=1 Tax=Desulfarculus baarsii (strain ATCC 33931 / DSM 2075 / LMG 7858 / VKM B-1802 / 2st14) TaxID=644282 RepID=E1QI89_DESB2|nr:AAA family ATPase [Desulfarculus baarsii]ADK85406.1 Cobyrinic acid ac-diamide synthase [Desulfarculus baarsii DSM 2075]
MKLAVSGKGGVGKTTFSAMLARAFAEKGLEVLAVDADPDANLGQALGFPDYQTITPVSEMKELIDERTESKNNNFGTYFKLNPNVSDLPEKLSVAHDGVRLMVMGTVKKGGGGCICPASTMLKVLMTHMVLTSQQVLILDMEAGLEHLGRGTSRGVDFLIVVVEPGRRSVDTAHTIKKLAADLGVQKILIVGNKIRGPQDEQYLRDALAGFEFLGFISHDQAIIEADMANKCPALFAKTAKEQVGRMADELLTRVAPKK